MDHQPLNINLDLYRTAKSPVFAGRDRGIEVKKKITLEKLNSASEISFSIPDDVYALNSSFLLGLLGETIKFHKKNGLDSSKIIKVPDEFKSTFEETIREAQQDDCLL